MIQKRVLREDRVRKIKGGFSFLPHRFLTAGFLASLRRDELLLYFFLVLVSDRQGLSFYAYDAICSLLELTLDEYIDARNALIHKDLLAFDGTLFQVLELPATAAAKQTKAPPRCPAIARQIQLSLMEVQNAQ